jgi:hypothetical protein
MQKWSKYPRLKAATIFEEREDIWENLWENHRTGNQEVIAGCRKSGTEYCGGVSPLRNGRRAYSQL